MQQVFKSDLKKELLSYFDEIKFEIDIKSQELINELDETQENGAMSTNEINELVILNEQLLDRVNNELKTNLENVDQYFTKIENLSLIDISLEELKKTLYRVPFFIRNDHLKEEYRTNKIGLLLITDWYLDKNQISFLNFALKKLKLSELFRTEIALHEDILKLKFVLNDSIFKIMQQNGMLIIRAASVNKELEELDSLDLNLSCIKSIDKSTFKLLKKLKFLKLGCWNKLESIGTSTFHSSLTQLEELTIHGDDIKTIEDKSFRYFKNLKKLELRVPNLVKINHLTLYGLINLKELKIIAPNVNEIQRKCFSSLKLLECLTIQINPNISNQIETHMQLHRKVFMKKFFGLSVDFSLILNN